MIEIKDVIGVDIWFSLREVGVIKRGGGGGPSLEYQIGRLAEQPQRPRQIVKWNNQSKNDIF